MNNMGSSIKFVAPNDVKKLRSCLNCHLVKTERQFRERGCDNCEIFRAKGFTVFEYTTANFESIINLTDPSKSGIARHLNLITFLPGSYSLKVGMEMSQELLESVKNIPKARNP